MHTRISRKYIPIFEITLIKLILLLKLIFRLTNLKSTQTNMILLFNDLTNLKATFMTADQFEVTCKQFEVEKVYYYTCRLQHKC